MRSRASGAARSRRFFLLLLRTRSCAIGAEALSHQLNQVFAFLGPAMSDRAGARLPVETPSANQIVECHSLEQLPLERHLSPGDAVDFARHVGGKMARKKNEYRR